MRVSEYLYEQILGLDQEEVEKELALVCTGVLNASSLGEYVYFKNCFSILSFRLAELKGFYGVFESDGHEKSDN